jgi:tRNA (guanine-N7-)-methyltransferase
MTPEPKIDSAADSAHDGKVKPPPDRLYGRIRGHVLRPRQQRLLTETLPRIRLTPEQATDPLTAFPRHFDEMWLEIGFGGGEHALAQAEAHPDVALVASEVFENGLCSLLTRLVPDEQEATAPLPANLRLWPEDARVLLRQLPNGILSKLFLMFPDPWPKSRHAKRRFVHPTLVAEIARVMRPGGEWRIASDDPTYQAWTKDVLAAQNFFAGEPPATTRPEGWPVTRYEAKAIAAQRTPFYWSLTRRVDV